ncbi:hypothetical protein MNBD_NITROSPIRAE01-1406 [hydrothermal vent metagenome]|uniref:Outer membrane lipoprotein-sorting protein n=1 Tax=hydrothermal vent metagenome TaxID=652676 RepID=A0A3B1DMP1_9ZZZZ
MKHSLLQSKIILLGLLCFITLSACSGKQIKTTSPIPKQDASLQELLSLYQQRSEMNSNIKALVQVNADLGTRGHHKIQSVWQSSKDTIHLRGLNLFGGDLFRLDIDATSFSLKTAADPQALEADLEFFHEIAGRQIPFGSIDLLRWVQRAGLPDTAFPKIPVLEKSETHFTIYLFSIFEGHAILIDKIIIERSAFRVKRVELFDHTGLRRSIIELDDYRRVDGRDFPFSVKGITGNEIITLNFKEVSFPPTKTKHIQ